MVLSNQPIFVAVGVVAVGVMLAYLWRSSGSDSTGAADGSNDGAQGGPANHSESDGQTRRSTNGASIDGGGSASTASEAGSGAVTNAQDPAQSHSSNVGTERSSQQEGTRIFRGSDHSQQEGTRIFGGGDQSTDGLQNGQRGTGEVTLSVNGEAMTVPLGEPVGRRIRRHMLDLDYTEQDARHISREHLEFTERNGTLNVRDLASTGGTKLNGTELTVNEWCPLSPGDTLTLADKVELVVQGCDTP